MPIYEYQCDKCGRVEELLQKITDEPLRQCNHCSGNLHKLISHSAFHLKGTGWYVTDYAGKSGNPNNAKNSENAPKAADSGDSKPTDSGTPGNDD